jgi:hypothetical protein
MPGDPLRDLLKSLSGDASGPETHHFYKSADGPGLEDLAKALGDPGRRAALVGQVGTFSANPPGRASRILPPMRAGPAPRATPPGRSSGSST